MQKLWVVLKVSLTRPWVWLMMSFPLLMLFPLLMTLGGWQRSFELSSFNVSIPAFDVPEMVVSDSAELIALGETHQLQTIEGLQCYSLPSDIEFHEQGVVQGHSALSVDPSQLRSSASWSILDAVPQLQYLAFQPPNSLNSLAWQRIGKLHQLETLTLESIGAVDAEAYRTVGHDLPAALGQLTKLRQLNVNNAGGNLDWALPPLPNLEYVILGFNKQLDTTLETLATHSPRLQTLTLYTFQDFVYTERMLAALRRMSSLRRVYIISSSRGEGDDLNETSRQVESLRRQLPAVSVQRGAYSLTRLGLSALLYLAAMMVCFVAWLQSGLTLAQPLAAVMPGHRGPHLFWPIAISLGSTLVFVPLAMWLGMVWFVALPLALLATMMTTTLIPGHDIRPDWKRVTNLVSAVDALSLFTLLGIGATAPRTMDAFLLGDYPVLAILLMLWFLFATGWKVVRAERLHRILAASGMTGIPGLNLGFQGALEQAYQQKPGGAFGAWQFRRMENAIDRRLAKMDRSDWADMLRQGAPSNIGGWFGLGMMLVFMVVFRIMTRQFRQPFAQMQPFIGMGAMQATMMILMLNAVSWIGRRESLVADFLRPVSRPKFWRALRMAILRDLIPAMLFALVGGMYAAYLKHKGIPAPLMWVNALLSAAGFLALFHGWVVLMVIGKRLWLHATFAVVTSVIAASFSAASVVQTQGESADPLMATLLALGVLAAGVLMQWGVTRKLPDWELG